jgi:hypothetical protein
MAGGRRGASPLSRSWIDGMFAAPRAELETTNDRHPEPQLSIGT